LRKTGIDGKIGDVYSGRFSRLAPQLQRNALDSAFGGKD
jgi:hypothetical protein